MNNGEQFPVRKRSFIVTRGEKADSICVLDGIRILIYSDTRLTEDVKVENSSIETLLKVHAGVSGRRVSLDSVLCRP